MLQLSKCYIKKKTKINFTQGQKVKTNWDIKKKVSMEGENGEWLLCSKR